MIEKNYTSMESFISCVADKGYNATISETMTEHGAIYYDAAKGKVNAVYGHALTSC